MDQTIQRALSLALCVVWSLVTGKLAEVDAVDELIGIFRRRGIFELKNLKDEAYKSTMGDDTWG